MNRNNRLMLLVVVCAVLGLCRWMGWFGSREGKVTPVQAAEEPLLPTQPFVKPGGGLSFMDSHRIERHWDSAMTEFERIQMAAIKVNDRQTLEALNAPFERLKASLERMQTGEYDKDREDEEIRSIRQELRRMGLVREGKQ